MLSLFSLTSIFVPSLTGTQNFFTNSEFSKKSFGAFAEDFEDTTYLDGASTAFGWGTGTVTNERDFSWDILDHYCTESPVVDVEVQGRKAYLGLYNTSQTDAVTILNINDLSDIKLQGVEDDASFMQTKAIDVEGDTLVAGQFHTMVSDAIVIQDVTDPFNPQWKWVHGSDNFVTDIELYGHLAYYTSFNDDGNRSLRYVDLENPFVVGSYVSCAWDCNLSLGLTVNGGVAYIAASTEGFYMLNITNKAHPTEIGYIDTPGNATDVIVDGGFAYLADGPAGVHVIDIRDPTNPTITSTYDTPGHAQKLVKQGRTLFIADGAGKVQVCDVFDPHHISVVTEISPIPYTYDVALFGGDLIAGTQDGIYSVQIGYMANFSNSWYPNPFEAPEIWDVRVVDGIAYIAGGEDGVYAVDVRNPLQPILLDNYITGPGYDIRKLDINGKFLYAICKAGPFIFDVSDPTDIKEINYFLGSGFHDVFVHGEIMYASFTTGFTIWNVTDHSVNDILVNYIPGIHQNNTAIWTQGTHVYMVEGVSAGSDTFSCYKVTDFTSPALDDSLLRTTPMYDIQVVGDLAYLGAGGWLAVHNVSDPTSITYPDYETTTSWGVWNFGRYTMSAELTKGVRLYNITDVYDFKLHSNYSAPSGAIQVTASGDYTYVANQTSLVTLRHFCSAADTFIPGTSFAQSLEIDSGDDIIYRATLDKDDRIPLGTYIEYFMSADGGAHWEAVVSGVEHIFANPGNDLRWRAEFTGPRDQSARLYEITIDYFYNEQPTIPGIYDPGNVINDSSVVITWNASTDDGTIDHYELQVDSEIGFATPTDYNASGLSQEVTGLTDGTYYFRARAVDDFGLASDWSDVVDITVEIPATNVPWWVYVIIGGGLVLIAVIIVVFVMVRKRKVPTR